MQEAHRQIRVCMYRPPELEGLVGLSPIELVCASQAGVVKATPGLSHLYTAQDKMLKEHKRAREVMTSLFPEQENANLLEGRSSQEIGPICKL